MEICGLSEEEKKAIDDLFALTHINGYIDLYSKEQARIYTSLLSKWQNGVKVLLNLIQKKDTEINKLKKINDLMAKSILNYDDQLEINYYKDKKHVKETFEEYAMKEDK